MLATAVEVIQKSKNYKNAANKPPPLDLNKPVSVADAVRWFNRVWGKQRAASTWRYLFQYAVPNNVANKLLDGEKKKDHYDILKLNIIQRKDEDDNFVFTKCSLEELDTAVINAMRLEVTAAEESVQEQAPAQEVALPPAANTTGDDQAQPANTDASPTPDRVADSRAKRHKVN